MDRADELWEIEQIKQLKARYFRLMDTNKWDEWAQVFTTDCRLLCPDDGMTEPIVGRDNIAAFPPVAIRPGKSCHHGHMPEITLTSPTTATGIWAMADEVEAAPAGTEPWKLVGRGHYHETYERGDDGAWRIASLTLTRLKVDRQPQ